MSCSSTRASADGLSSLPRTLIERLVVSAAFDGRRPYCAYEPVESMVKRMVATTARMFIFPTLNQNGCDLPGLRKKCLRKKCSRKKPSAKTIFDLPGHHTQHGI